MKKVGKPVFFIILVLVLALTAVSMIGIHTMYGDIKTSKVKGVENIRWGMDLEGGIEIAYAPPEEYLNPTAEDIMTARKVMISRLLSAGYTNHEVHADSENKRLLVRIPAESDQGKYELEQIARELGGVHFLTIREGAEYDQETYQATGVTAESILLDSTHVKKARATTDAGGRNVVKLTLTKEGKELLTEESGRLLGSQISFWVDGNLLGMLDISEVLSGGTILIPGAPNVQVANMIADMIDDGAMPFQLYLDDMHTTTATYSPTLKTNLIWVGLAGLALVFVFLLIRYRASGVVAVIALIGQIGIMTAATTGFLPDVNGPVVTLAGFVGWFVAILLGVFSNLLICQRMKKDLQLGKSLEGARETAISQSFPLLLDASLILALVGLVIVIGFKGGIFAFGHALLAGVISNFIMTGFLNRYMLRSLSQYKSLRKPWHYGGAKNDL